jgi:hypothetical protein
LKIMDFESVVLTKVVHIYVIEGMNASYAWCTKKRLPQVCMNKFYVHWNWQLKILVYLKRTWWSLCASKTQLIKMCQLPSLSFILKGINKKKLVNSCTKLPTLVNPN